MHMIAVDRPGVNNHFVRPGCLANQLAASLPHVAAENGEPIFRNPYNVVLAVPDGMAAAFVALHDPVYTSPIGDSKWPVARWDFCSQFQRWAL